MADGAGPLIFYVEDEVLLRDLALIAFEDAGYEVVTASRGAEAISFLGDRASELSALVTDIDLGPGPNGWDIAQHAREILPTLPVIYVSGGNVSEWPSRGVPGSVMLAKPYALSQLVVAVSSATIGNDAQAD